MAWTPITDLPETRLSLDAHGNVRRRSLESGQFVSGVVTPAYGEWGYGKTARLQAVDSDRDSDCDCGSDADP